MKNFWTEEKRGDMTQVEQLAAFVVRTRYEDLSEEARQQLKIRIIDALGCAIGALEGPPLNMLRVQLEDFGGKPLVTLIGGGKTAPDRAALYNAAWSDTWTTMIATLPKTRPAIPATTSARYSPPASMHRKVARSF